MSNKKSRLQEVEEVPYGVYLWRTPEGQYISDGEGHYLMINSMKGDPKRIESLRKAAKECGVDGGYPEYFSGHRVVTDEEFDEQRQRMLFGLVPDKFDIPAIEEERRNASNRR